MWILVVLQALALSNLGSNASVSLGWTRLGEFRSAQACQVAREQLMAAAKKANVTAFNVPGRPDVGAQVVRPVEALCLKND